MNAENLKVVVAGLSELFRDQRITNDGYKDTIKVTLKDFQKSEGITNDEAKIVSAIAKARSKGEFDKMEEFTSNLLHIIDMSKDAQF